MKFAFRSLLFGLLLVVGLGSQAAVQRPIRQQGLQISLTTSRYEVERTVGGAGDASLAASVALTNLSNKAVSFSFPNPATAALAFQFRILDSTGTEIWESDPDLASPVVATPASLARRSTWKRTLQIPLSVHGEPLAVGRYTLEATLAGTPTITATSIFSVVAPAITGICGQVTLRSFGPIIFNPAAAGVTTNPVPAVGTPVEITEVRPANARTTRPLFTWSGITDLNGNYQATTPAGTFLVKVYGPVIS